MSRQRSSSAGSASTAGSMTRTPRQLVHKEGRDARNVLKWCDAPTVRRPHPTNFGLRVDLTLTWWCLGVRFLCFCCMCVQACAQRAGEGTTSLSPGARGWCHLQHVGVVCRVQKSKAHSQPPGTAAFVPRVESDDTTTTTAAATTNGGGWMKGGASRRSRVRSSARQRAAGRRGGGGGGTGSRARPARGRRTHRRVTSNGSRRSVRSAGSASASASASSPVSGGATTTPKLNKDRVRTWLWAIVMAKLTRCVLCGVWCSAASVGVC